MSRGLFENMAVKRVAALFFVVLISGITSVHAKSNSGQLMETPNQKKRRLGFRPISAWVVDSGHRVESQGVLMETPNQMRRRLNP